MDDEQFRRLLAYFDLSWSGYRRVRKGVKKRVCRHMLRVQVHTMEEYLRALDKNPSLREQCLRLMTVSISRFFRDRQVWDVLEKHILPGFVERAGKIFRVWSAGCGCGEEVYSFKILWEEIKSHGIRLPLLELTGSDLNPSYLGRAESGVYAPSSLRSLPGKIKGRYFDLREWGPGYQVKPSLKTGIQWVQQDLHFRTPSPPFHIIFLRNNILTYDGPEIKARTFRKIAKALVPGGFLIIGSHERLPLIAPRLLPHPHNPLIFERPTSPGA